MVKLDSDGDLIDSAHIPADTPANELSAFIVYALTTAANTLDDLMDIEERKHD